MLKRSQIWTDFVKMVWIIRWGQTLNVYPRFMLGWGAPPQNHGFLARRNSVGANSPLLTFFNEIWYNLCNLFGSLFKNKITTRMILSLLPIADFTSIVLIAHFDSNLVMCSNYGIEISFAHASVLHAIPFFFIYNLTITEDIDATWWYHIPNPIILTINECPISELNCNQKKVSKSPPQVTRGQPPHRPVQHCCRSYTSESNNHAPALTVSSSLSVCPSVRLWER